MCTTSYPSHRNRGVLCPGGRTQRGDRRSAIQQGKLHSRQLSFHFLSRITRRLEGIPIFNRKYIFIQDPFSIGMLVYRSVTSLKFWHRYCISTPNRHFGKLENMFKTHHFWGVYVKFPGCSESLFRVSGFLVDSFIYILAVIFTTLGFDNKKLLPCLGV